MWSYYSHAYVCYAYLSDVSGGHELTPDAREELLIEEFRKSRWFTRAWTLQELIAPVCLHFYNASWHRIGSRGNNLLQLIHEITGIPKHILAPWDDLRARLMRLSVAERMSWAAPRICRRQEDRAYSLLGIFDINMPLLYGEGRKAFLRLQEEIIKTSTDHSILVHSDTFFHGSLFARNPLAFRISGNIRAREPDEPTESYSMTNRGLLITLPVIKEIPPNPISGNRRRIVVALNCRDGANAVTILLEQSKLALFGSRLPLEYIMVGVRGTTTVRTREEDKRTIVIIREILPSSAELQSILL